MLFAAAWLALCHERQVPASGDYVAHAIGGWPLFAMRGSDGVVRAFRNQCRHQGMQVADAPAGHCSETMRCRFHGWTYDLAGRFVTAPDPVAPADNAPGTNDLARLPVFDVRGFLCCNLGDAEASDAEHALASVLPDASHSGAFTTEIGCNWKTYLEHRLADPVASFAWPMLVVAPASDGAIVEQVIPRTFLRTRVVYHALGISADALQRVADSHAAQCKALQEMRAGGGMPELTGRVGALWERIRSALADQ